MGSCASQPALTRRLLHDYPHLLSGPPRPKLEHRDFKRSQRRKRPYRSAAKATVSPDGSDDEWGVHNYKGVLAYKGGAYRGWQIQNGSARVPTVQEKLQKAITAVKREGPAVQRLQGAGRTDAGVHARGQVFNFFSHKLTPAPERLLLGINANLPQDIRLLSIARVPPDFSARYSALSKVYSFRVQTGRVADPFLLGLSQHVWRPLDVTAMRVAAAALEGTHDFSQFSSMPSRPVWPVKQLYSVRLAATPGGLTLTFDGSGFLYNQCRHMAGCLLQIGLGRMPASRVPELLRIGSSQHPGLKYRGWPLAAAEGVCLEAVRYPPHDDPSVLLHPSWPHDAHGRLWSDDWLPQDEWLALTGQRLQASDCEPVGTS